MLIKFHGSINSIKIVTRGFRKFFNSYFVEKENILSDLLKVKEGIFGNKFVNMLISITNLK